MTTTNEKRGFNLLTEFCKEKKKQVEIRIIYNVENNYFNVNVLIDQTNVINTNYEKIENNFNDIIALQTLVIIDNFNARKYSDLIMGLNEEPLPKLRDTVICPKMPESLSILVKPKTKETERKPFRLDERRREEFNKRENLPMANREEKEVEQTIERICSRIGRSLELRFNEIKGGYECFVRLNEFSAIAVSDRKYDAKCIAYMLLLKKIFSNTRSNGEIMKIVRSQQLSDTLISLLNVRLPMYLPPLQQQPMIPQYPSYYSTFNSSTSYIPQQNQQYSYNPYK
ncbi:hypothetical protein EHI8A_036260 [Entamoeba histolytica HM-1:IMSS-B]|uniref:Uncharacterized protein n=5 Tax=Entamoeba histolytica TaxID=5759 RepID=C4M5L2_ENTH1|nr:hypothetical protein EHI_001980 [Entamoeba histolytica HM-1:IMSS]EMH73345.1 hypothetical protein EHI8A_036260 [Entamoeba histolytica HM-1:IMSS-B]EMS11297.1 hypothetical protein KM1_076310 [Entamoeba histolytica HM-3:IMSS]ENY65732.1 hypothetical protein EHI7A_037570 [Entamoeba histolytica HM-1:IMSS-A]GAT96720.1 hypothetical protein CL6EHI_001980 [Entamoeba histolytica]EAL47835.1 hypothetical protein EHI_001980 [Entamoeba histolytica HM-1:IMSS]|eukprot:XP_653221.1 hypothetical protein EHI_001980 [Entamoeba histolytica HM-1:IMSS]